MTLFDLLSNNLYELTNNYYIAPILIACLLSAMMGYYKPIFKGVGLKENSGFKRFVNEIIEWVASFTMSLFITFILYLLWKFLVYLTH